jgi:hypothetical protein
LAAEARTWLPLAPDVTGFEHKLAIPQWSLRRRVMIYRKHVRHPTAKNFRLDLFTPDDGHSEYYAVATDMSLGLAYNAARAFQLDTLAAPKPRLRKRTYAYRLRSLCTLHFLLISRAGRLTRIGGRNVLRLSQNRIIDESEFRISRRIPHKLPPMILLLVRARPADAANSQENATGGGALRIGAKRRDGVGMGLPA